MCFGFCHQHGLGLSPRILAFLFFRLLVVAGLGESLAKALRLDVENDAVMNQPVDSGDGHGAVRKYSFPAGEWLVVRGGSCRKLPYASCAADR